MSTELIVAIVLGAPAALLVVFKIIRWLDAQAEAFRTLQKDVPTIRDSLLTVSTCFTTFQQEWRDKVREVTDRLDRIERNGKKGEGGSL